MGCENETPTVNVVDATEREEGTSYGPDCRSGALLEVGVLA